MDFLAGQPSASTVYRICYECGHVYQGREDLLTAYLEDLHPVLADRGAVDPETITDCPLCRHTF